MPERLANVSVRDGDGCVFQLFCLRSKLERWRSHCYARKCDDGGNVILCMFGSLQCITAQPDRTLVLKFSSPRFIFSWGPSARFTC